MRMQPRRRYPSPHMLFIGSRRERACRSDNCTAAANPSYSYVGDISKST